MVSYCCVNGCKNNGNNLEEYPNTKTLFHVFPTKPELKARWLKAIGQPDWDPPEYAYICSDHFSLCQENSNFENSLLEVCRICLACYDDVKLYSLQYGKLKLYIDTILPIKNDSCVESLPQFVCYECAVHLKKCYNMVKKSETSQAILLDIFAQNGEVTKSLVKNINRDNLDLKSTLAPHNITPSYLFNYEFNHQQNLSCLTSINYVCNLKENKKELDSDSDTTSIQIDHNDDNNLMIKLEQETDLKSDNNKVLYYEGEINIREEYSISHINNDDNTPGLSQQTRDENSGNNLRCMEKFNDDSDSIGLSEKSTDEHSENVLRSTEKQNTTVRNKMKTRKSAEQSPKSECEGIPYKKHFNIVRFKTLQEKIDEWHKLMEKKAAQSNNVYKCEICSKIFANLQTYKNHSNLHDPISGNAECPVCKIRLKNETSVRRHMSTVHSKKFYCKSCPKSFPNGKAAERHHMYHIGREYKCKKCSYSTRHPSSLSKHNRIDHPHPFACELCGRTCVGSNGLQLHRDKQHPGETVPEGGKKFPCEKCNFSFTNEEALRVHLHTSAQHKEIDKKPSLENTCRYCQQRFPSHRDLRVHIDSDHDGGRKRKPHGEFNTKYPKGCEHCGEVVPNSRHYYWHMRREHPHKQIQGIRPLMCEICGKRFQVITHLRRHKLRHSSPKVPCPICKKLFYDEKTVDTHVSVVHRAERHYTCNTCGNTFSTLSNLARHKKIHTDLTPYECSLCGKHLKHKDNLQTHIRTVHQKKLYPSELNRKKRTRKRARDTK